ncbi:MAG: LacI family DNA-binding transcriptional regulator [Lachnospiraceae bacterium]|nr:LacI family DNA-binding transcriptional regulator [Lachnospiraceae bacterium]MBO5145629.1 LacI family DNA-binding transcriptional regulator [Lachnospiraceae bacterium]
MLPQKSNEGKAITIYDIAKEAEVSPSTVSRVLTNSARVRPEKRQKIEALIAKYNFKPNALAKGLADTRTRTIGVLAADIRNPYYASLFVACEQAAKEVGYTVVLYNTLGKTENEVELLGKLQEQKVDAIIQLGGRADDLVSSAEYVEIINEIMSSIPVVVTGKLDGTRCHAVRIDSMKSMELLMEHLLGLGHRRIALIGGRRNVLATFEKYQKYKLMLKENMIAYDDGLVAPDGGYDFETGYRQMNEMLAKRTDMTAVIAINDFAAMGVMKSLNEHGIRIPEDMSVVSYDNTYMSEMAMPRLTSIDYNFGEYGRKLIDTSIAVIEGRKKDNLRMVMPAIVVRESSGPCRVGALGKSF